MLSSCANDSYMSGVFPNAFQSFTHLILMPSLWGRCHYFAHFTGEEMEPEKSPKPSSQQMTESRIPPRCLTPSFSYSVELLLWGKKVRKWKLINYFRQWDAQILASCPEWAGFSGKGPAGFNGPAGTGRAIGWVLMSSSCSSWAHWSFPALSVSRVRDRPPQPYPSCSPRPLTSTSSPSCLPVSEPGSVSSTN